MENFKTGDVVQHKSGGPKMIVKGLANDEVICEWLDKEHRVQERAFHKDTLKEYQGRVYVTGPSKRDNRSW